MHRARPWRLRLLLAVCALVVVQLPLGRAQQPGAASDPLAALRWRYIGPVGNRGGTAYGPPPERGVFSTTDGGKTWERVLVVDENTGCADIVMDPSNPRIVFAGMWQFEIKTWGRFSGGPGSGLYRSADGGTTWTKITGNGLPAHQVGKFGLAIARANPNRIYALIETSDGVPWKGDEADRGKLWRSDDGGRTWQLINYDRNLGGRAHYFFPVGGAPGHQKENQLF